MPTTEEQAVRISADLYNARSSLKAVFGDAYNEKVERPRAVLRAIAQRLDGNVLGALLEILRRIGDDCGPWTKIALMAAAVDLTEELSALRAGTTPGASASPAGREGER